MRRSIFSEMYTCLTSPALYVVAGVFLCLSGLFFFNEVISVSILASRIAQTQVSGGVSMNALLLRPFFTNVSTLVIFLCPLVSLALFSGGNNLGPVSGTSADSGGGVAWKFIAALVFIGGMISLNAVLMGILAVITSPDWGLVVSSCLGLVLLGGAVLSMGVFASSATQRHASAAALTMGLALIFWIAGSSASLLPEEWPATVLREVSLSHHLSRFFEGIVSMRDISFFLGLTVFFLALARTALDSGRQQGRAAMVRLTRALRGLVFILLLVLALVLIHLIAINHDVFRNVSRAGDNRLDYRTENILKRLKTDVEILVFDPAGIEQKRSYRLLGMFARGSGRITFRVMDPDLWPALARTYGITRYGQAVIRARGQTVVLNRAGEEEIANAILSLEQGKKKNIYVLAGHGESDIFSNARSGLSGLRESLERSGYGVHKSLLAGQENVPWDADLLIIPGPRAEMGPEELYAVSRFVDRGGNVLMALEPRMDGGLKALLSELGVELNGAMITDPSSKALGGDESMLVVDSYGGLKGLGTFSHTTVFPTARPLGIGKQVPPRTSISLVAKTSEMSRAVADAGPDGGALSLRGPLNLALLVRKTAGTGARPGIMVFGDVDFLTNAYLTVSGNRDLALACVGLLLHGDSYVAIDARRAGDRPFVLTPRQGLAVFLASVVILPMPVFLIGLLVKRRGGRA